MPRPRPNYVPVTLAGDDDDDEPDATIAHDPREPAALTPGIVHHPDDDDDDDDEALIDTPIEPRDETPPDAFELSVYRSRLDRTKNRYGAKILPVWVEWVCDTSNEMRVLAQIAYTFREGGSRLYEVNGYKVAYYRINKLVAELPKMTFKKVRSALDGLFAKGILVEMGWHENSRRLRISAGRVAELVAEWESQGSSK